MKLFENYCVKTLEHIINRPVQTLFVSVFVLIISSLQFRDLKTELKIFDIADAAFPSTLTSKHIKNEFNDGNSVSFVFYPEKHKYLSETDLCQLKRWINDQETNNPDLIRVHSPFNLKFPVYQQNDLKYQSLIILNCETPSAESTKNLLAPFLQTPWNNLTTNGTDLAFEFIFRDTGPKNQFNPDKISPVLEDIKKNVLPKLNRINFIMSGEGAFSWHFKKVIHRNLQVIGMMMLFVLVLCRLFCGTWSSGFLFLVTIVISLIQLFGAMAYFGFPIDMLTNSLALIVIISGLEDFLFMAHVHSKKEKEGVSEAFLDTMKELITPGFLTSMTTVLGIGSLFFSPIDIISRFGLLASLGALLEWVSLFFIFPALLTLLPKKTSLTNYKKILQPSFLIRLSNAYPNRLYRLVSITAILLSGYFSIKLNIQDVPEKNFPPGHMHRQSQEYMHQNRGYNGKLIVVFPQGMGFPQSQEIYTEIIDKLTNISNIHLIENHKKIENYLTMTGYQPIDHLIAINYRLTADFRRFVSDQGTQRIFLYLKQNDLISINQTISEIKTICQSDCYPTGLLTSYAEYSNAVVSTLMHSFFLSLGIVGLVLYFLCLFRKSRHKIAIVLTSLWGPIIVLGLIGLLEIPINLVTGISIAVLVGLTGDNAIQYLFGTQNSDIQTGIKQRSLGSILLTFVLATCCLLLLFDTLVPVNTLGLILFFGFLISLAGDLFLLRSFISNT